MEFSTKLPSLFWPDLVERLRMEACMEDVLFMDFTWKSLLFAGAGGGNKEELLKEMANVSCWDDKHPGGFQRC